MFILNLKSYARQARGILVFFALSLSVCCSNVSAQQGSPNPIVASDTSEKPSLLFNSRIPLGNHQKKYYKACSIYIYIKSFLQVEIINLSTFKISSCPSVEFRNITAASVTAQLKTIAPVTLVSMIGPYFQLMDENNSVIESASVPIGPLNFSPVMYAEVGFRDLLTNFNSLFRWTKAEGSYNPIASKRNMNFVWYKGSTIYTIVTDKGKRFVMTYFSPADIDTFSSVEEVTQKLDETKNLLTLPPGWKFETIVLDKVLRLNQIPFQGHSSETLMDELDNIYIHTAELNF